MWTSTMYQLMLHVIAISDWLFSHSRRRWTLHHHQSFWTELNSSSWKILWSRFCNSLRSRSIVISGHVRLLLGPCWVILACMFQSSANWCHSVHLKSAKRPVWNYSNAKISKKLLKFLQPIGKHNELTRAERKAKAFTHYHALDQAFI